MAKKSLVEMDPLVVNLIVKTTDGFYGFNGGKEPTITSLFDFLCYFLLHLVYLFVYVSVCVQSMWRPEDDLWESALSIMWAPGIELRSQACWHVYLPAESFYWPSMDGFKACL